MNFFPEIKIKCMPFAKRMHTSSPHVSRAVRIITLPSWLGSLHVDNSLISGSGSVTILSLLLLLLRLLLHVFETGVDIVITLEYRTFTFVPLKLQS